MPLTFTRQAVRRVDHLAVERYGIPGMVLMENAARGLVHGSLQFLYNLFHNRAGGDVSRWPVTPERFPEGVKVLIIAGGGNNGGDGFAAARHLHNLGVICTIVLTRPAETYTGDARTNLDICRAMRLNLIDAAAEPLATLAGLPDHHLMLDGLLGTGLSEAVREPTDKIIGWMNGRSERIVAIDIPSGLDCDTGEPLGVAVRAAATMTFVGRKAGFANPRSRIYTGAVHVIDIGAPRELVEELGTGSD